MRDKIDRLRYGATIASITGRGIATERERASRGSRRER